MTCNVCYSLHVQIPHKYITYASSMDKLATMSPVLQLHAYEPGSMLSLMWVGA